MVGKPTRSAVPADAQPIGSNPSDRELLLASLAGMRQLQGVVADMGRKDRDDSDSPTHPDAVKLGITSFPALAEFKSDEGSLAYQDWLQTVTGLVGDVSDSAAGVLNAVDRAYGVWISSSPIDRLRVEPTVPAELLQGRWVRVNFRVCSMLMKAIPEAIQQTLLHESVTPQPLQSCSGFTHCISQAVVQKRPSFSRTLMSL